MKKYSVYLLVACFTAASCSTSKEIKRFASKGILSDSSFVDAHTGISVFEPSTGKYWYTYQAEKYFVPASNTKIVSCFAAMKFLGDSIPGIRYQIKNDSTIAIQGTGDPTFLHRAYQQQPIFDFLKLFKIVQINRPQFTEYLGNGWSWGDYLQEYMAQRSAMPIYGNVVKVTWDDENSVTIHPPLFELNSTLTKKLPDGFDVEKSWDTNDFTFVPGREKMMEIPFKPDVETLVRLLRDTLHTRVEIIDMEDRYSQEIKSRPIDEYLSPMMHESDNFFAEQSLLMAGDALTRSLNTRKAVDTLLRSVYKNLPQKPNWADGSGLSRYNLFSPNDFVFILNMMEKEFGMERIKKILPTGGTGTISSYYLADSGRIFVKTGTLNGVVALSGFLYTHKNKFLIFSVLVNNHSASSTSIRKGVENFIHEIMHKY